MTEDRSCDLQSCGPVSSNVPIQCRKLPMAMRICHIAKDGTLISPQRGTPWTGPVMHAHRWSQSAAVLGECGLHAVRVVAGAVPACEGHALLIVEYDGRVAAGKVAIRAERMSIQQIIVRTFALKRLVSARYPEIPVVVRRLGKKRQITLDQDGKVLIRFRAGRHGRWETRYADGTVRIERFRAGQWHGRCETRYADGAIRIERFRAGQLHGRWETRYADGRVVIRAYLAGQPHGRWETRYASGTVVIRRFRDGQLQE